MLKKILITFFLFFQTSAFAAAVSGQGTWETSLKARDINGDGIIDAYYDTALNITWLANANLAAGSVYDDDEYAQYTSGGNTTTDGAMTLANARSWASELNLYGESGWRLPNSGFNFVNQASQGVMELDHLYKITLGNNYFNQPNPGLTNTGPFQNIKIDHMYWLETETIESWYAWHYGFDGIGAGGTFSNEVKYIWAVKDGDVLTVPEPNTLSLLFISAFLTLYCYSRKPLSN